MPNYYNPYYQQPQMNYQPQQIPSQIQNNGFISVRSELEARNYPVAPGNSITFKDETAPYVIQFYPKDFSSKKEVIKYLDKFNEDKSEDDKIIYTDMAEAISSLSGNIMDAITVVLIAFSSISLVVSSIMIAIITYISVLERTKEIGILRALGARRKDITRVFNAETFIIGMTSGLIGIGIALLLTIPINIVLYNLT